MTKWRFFQGLKGEWRWYRLDESGDVVSASDHAFSELKGCMANAERCGFHYTNYYVHAPLRRDPFEGHERRSASPTELIEEEWKFVRHYHKTWYWRHTQPNGSQRVSSRTFQTCEQCVEDAIKHGYVPRDREPTPHCLA
ncbi:MAG: hypothetical protein JWN13_684 [Betaproteobacteria bacterium]|nr:hypothetical protein [Betaproteobacteria bacterium]